MAKVATEVLKMGFTVAALPGNVVTADDETIAKYGWADKIKDDGKKARKGKAADADEAPAGADPNLPAGA